MLFIFFEMGRWSINREDVVARKIMLSMHRHLMIESGAVVGC